MPEQDEVRADDAPLGLPVRALLASGVSFTVADARAGDLPLVWVNPAFTATTGYPAEEVLGRNCRFLQGPGTDPGAVDQMRAALAAGEHLAVTVLNYRKDGSAFWNEVSASPVRDESGRLTHVVGVQADVTHRVELERQRVAALEAERVARADADQARAEAEQAHAKAERALSSAEQAATRLSTLAEATNLLAATLDVDESLDRLSGLVVPLLADWVLISLTDEHGRLGSRASVRHRDGHQELLERYAALVPSRLGPTGPLQNLLAGAPPSLRADFSPPARITLSPAEREIQDISLQLGASSLMFVPLVARQRVVGAMMLVDGRSGRRFTRGDLELAADLGRGAGLAIDNARLYTREHGIALTLQRGLLPTLVDVPGLELAAEYLPAAEHSQIGGDWWDVFSLPDGAAALAIGDVMGHDLAAAAAMGQLRSVLRTCAWAGDSPSRVLERMDQLVQGFDMAQLATCVYARLEPPDAAGNRLLRWANAGHLPPVLLAPDGSVQALTGAVSVPLGAPCDDGRALAEVTLPPGGTVLLYTDGLIETRAGDIDSDVARLLADVARHRPEDGPTALIKRLTGSLGTLTDDVALLAVQVA